MRNLMAYLSRWRLLQCLCLVLVSSTILLTTSIVSNASEVSITDNNIIDVNLNNTVELDGSFYQYRVGKASSSFDISDYISLELNDNSLYKVSFDTNVNLTADNTGYVQQFIIRLDTDYQIAFGSSYLLNANNNNSMSINSLKSFYLTGEYLKGNHILNISYIFRRSADASVNISGNVDFNITSIEVVNNADSSDYENGYNAGYADGETDGYDNGYSQGYLEGEESGFQEGQESVDTQSYYDAGYQRGYQVAYQEGYENGYAEGLKSVQSSSGSWGESMFLGSPLSVTRYGIPFYVSSYGLVDMEEYQSGVNGYFYNTVPGTYDGYSTLSYHIPFYDFSNGLTRVDSNIFEVKFAIRDIDLSLVCNDGNGTEIANLMRSRIENVYVLYNGRKYYGNYDIGTSYVDFDFVVEGVASPTWLSDSSMTLCFDIHNSVTLVTDSDKSHYISAEYMPKLSFSLGAQHTNYAVFIRPYYSNDRVSANIQNQTEEITGALEEQKEVQQSQLEEQKEQTETQKGIAASIKEFFGSFFDNLINSIIHVIVPTKEEMSELFDRLNDFFAETFGFLYYPFDFIIDAFNIFLEADSETGLTLPGFSIMGHEVWGNQTYDIASEPIVCTIFGYVRMGTGAMLAMWFVNYLRNFFDKRFGGGGN